MMQAGKQDTTAWGVVFPAGGAALALAAAYGSEWFLGFHPCEMCLWQRIPYALMVVLALTFFALKRRGGTFIIPVMALLLAIEVMLAFYHAGVEWRWWQGMTACSIGLGPGMSAEDMLRRIMEAPTISCTEPPFRFLGLSMAGWNGVYALALLAGIGREWKNRRKKKSTLPEIV